MADYMAALSSKHRVYCVDSIGDVGRTRITRIPSDKGEFFAGDA